MKTIELVVVTVGLASFGLNLLLWLRRAHKDLPPHRTITTAMAFTAIALVGVGLGWSVKASKDSVDLSPPAAEKLDRVVVALENKDFEAAARELDEFKATLVQTSLFPGIATSIVDRMSFVDLLALKRAADSGKTGTVQDQTSPRSEPTSDR